MTYTVCQYWQKDMVRTVLCSKVTTDTFGSLDPDSDPESQRNAKWEKVKKNNLSWCLEVFYEVPTRNTVPTYVHYIKK